MNRAAERRQRLLPLLPQEGLDALLISNPVNVTYLTGFTGDSSTVVLTRDRAILVSDPRYTGQIADECPDLETHIRPPIQRIAEASAEVLKKFGVHSVGFESGGLTVAEFEYLRELAPTVDWKGAGDRVEGLRLVKDDDELSRIRGAIAVAERAFTAFCALLRPEDTEIELCDVLEANVRRAGGQGTSFPPIVAVGDRAALPHAPPTDRPVSASEILLVDWGASAGGYKSDLTRVLATRTKSSCARPGGDGAKLEEVYEVVRQAQEAAIRAVRPGVEARLVDAAARKVIDDAGYGDAFNHGLGHGIGLQIHEGPALRANSADVLTEGMVFTIEPGIYLPGWGGVRLEDDVRVTADGCEILTTAPRDLWLLWANR
jgi:Xaa-Pro aminopeptidase